MILKLSGTNSLLFQQVDILAHVRSNTCSGCQVINGKVRTSKCEHTVIIKHNLILDA